MYGLTAIDKILVAGWKHASFLCYSMGARRTQISTFSRTQVRIAEQERLQSLFKMSMGLPHDGHCLLHPRPDNG